MGTSSSPIEYQGPLICDLCGTQWPCADTRRLCPPFLYPGSAFPDRIEWTGVYVTNLTRSHHG